MITWLSKNALFLISLNSRKLSPFLFDNRRSFRLKMDERSQDFGRTE